MVATSLKLEETLHRRLKTFVENNPLKLSQRQVLTQALMEYLDRHEEEVLPAEDRAKQHEIAELKQRLAELERQ